MVVKVQKGIIRKLYILRLFLCKNGYRRAEFLKRSRYFYRQGENCFFTSCNFGTEPWLIAFGDNVHVASGVRFITHDVAAMMFNKMQQSQTLVKRVGSIEIGDNVFVGAGSTILYDVKIGNRVIIAAGALVNRDVPDGCIYGGVPAKKIGDFDDYIKKNIEFSNRVSWNSEEEFNIIRQKQMDYFWKMKDMENA